jgi:hypothetical protein
VLDHDRVAALGDDARAVDAQAGELAEDGGDVGAGRRDPAERDTVHHELNLVVEHVAPRVEVAVVIVSWRRTTSDLRFTTFCTANGVRSGRCR